MFVPKSNERDMALFKAAEKFGYEQCQKYKIDSTHNMVHVNRVVKYADMLNQAANIACIWQWVETCLVLKSVLMLLIMAVAYDIVSWICPVIVAVFTSGIAYRYLPRCMSERELRIIRLACLFHDLSDRKYCNTPASKKEATDAVADWLHIHARADKDAIQAIIETMSYHEVHRYGYPQLGPILRAYHHVRVADLLDAYDVRRCYMYQVEKNPEMSVEKCWSMVVELFDERVLLQRDAYINLPYAYKLADMLHDLATVEIETHRTMLENGRIGLQLQSQSQSLHLQPTGFSRFRSIAASSASASGTSLSALVANKSPDMSAWQ
jgi:hypothetical protein